MSDPYVGEIRLFAGNFAPDGWLLCQGQLLSIDEYDTLFALIGTTYGGDGLSTFALPNLSSRMPMHTGGGRALADTGGAEQVTLTAPQLPVHSHTPRAAATTADRTSPSGAVWAASGQPAYATAANSSMSTAALTPAGGSQPHENMSPFLAVNFIISLFGIFPSPA